MIYLPFTKDLILPMINRPQGFAPTMAALSPVVWLRMNQSSGTESNLGSGGGNLVYGTSVSRFSSGGPVVGGGYHSNAPSSGQSYISSQVNNNYTTFTVGGFVKFPATGNQQASHSATVFSKRQFYATQTVDFPFSVVWEEANTRLQINLDSGGDFVTNQIIYTANGSFAVDVWHFIVIVVRPSGQNVEIYKNGSLLQTTAATSSVGSTTATNWVCGASNEAGGGVGLSECIGSYAEFFVIPGALTPSQINTLYNSRFF